MKAFVVVWKDEHYCCGSITDVNCGIVQKCFRTKDDASKEIEKIVRKAYKKIAKEGLYDEISMRKSEDGEFQSISTEDFEYEYYVNSINL